MAFATTAGHRETADGLDGSTGFQEIFYATAKAPADNTAAVILATAEATVQTQNGVHVERLGAGAVAINRARKGDSLRGTMREIGPDALPSAGAIWMLTDLFADYGEQILPKVAFAIASAPPSPDLILASTFAKPQLPTAAPESLQAALPPLPRARVPLPASFAAMLQKSEKDVALAYAPSGPDANEPFQALMKGPEGKKSEAEAGSAKQTSPKKKSLLGWFGKRNLRQFDKNQHGWASNPLPKSVHLAKEQNCLARGIYFEARGEAELGQAAVAQVILNRVKNPTYPETICGVVFQNKSWRGRCQFSFACDGIADTIASPEAWAVAQRVARDVTNGKVWLEEVADSTHYHADYVNPRWARSMKKVDRIGTHIFYRTKNGGWG